MQPSLVTIVQVSVALPDLLPNHLPGMGVFPFALHARGREGHDSSGWQFPAYHIYIFYHH